jgi:Phycobilisome protein
MPLSPEIQTLITKARIMSFEPWRSSHPAETIAIFQTADDNRLYLTDEELATIAAAAPDFSTLFPVVRLLRDQAPTIIDEARAGVLTAFPGITEPGGALYPAERADACWRDFWQFLRCVTYAIAGEHPHYTSHHGLEAMQQLYTALNVPLDAMVFGLKGLKVASLRRVDPAMADRLSPYFEHLIARVSFRGQAAENPYNTPATDRRQYRHLE